MAGKDSLTRGFIKRISILLFVLPLAVSMAQDAEQYFRKGEELQQQLRYKEAIAAFTRAIELEPNNSEAWRKRGFIKQILQDWSGAESDCTKALQLDPQNAKAYNLRGAIWRGRKDYPKALSDFR